MEKIPSKMDVGVKGKMDTNNDVHLSFDEIENNELMDVNSPLKKSRPRSTLYLVTKSLLIFVIPAVLIYMICASARGNEPGDLQPRQLKPGKEGGYNQFLGGKDSEDSQQTGIHRPNRYPTPTGTENENSGQDVAKRKTLDVLIKKDLQKKEREKQKNMEREQMEQEKKEAEKHREETKKEAKNDKTNDGKPHVPKKSRFDTDDEEDESSLPPTPVKGRSMFKKRVKRRSPSPQKFKSEEKKQMGISCLGESAPVYESSGPFYDVNKCEQERKILECTDNSKVKACIRDNDEKSLLAVCTINICLYDQACPKVTRDLNNASVVDSQYNQCQSCKNRESLQSRLNEYGNVGAECLNISGTSPQPIGTNEDDGLDLNVAIPISVLVPIIVLGIGLGIGFWCVKYRRGRHNQQNGNNASPVDQERNGGGSIEFQTRNGGAGSVPLMQNGGAGSEPLMQNGGAGSEPLMQNGGAGSVPLMQNGGAGSEPLMQNGGVGSQLMTQNGEQGDAEV
ncbi:uncharacterized protein LOC128185885 [Crassostrea angulata]|uniref:uncharacterized protein LOC128185885 n=1 Tax=Magallana angulata TaxID=2784310 RepID=UPI0022B1836C|nr:uncharacterized protein LOC128185885 [Crassostrea angulata]